MCHKASSCIGEGKTNQIVRLNATVGKPDVAFDGQCKRRWVVFSLLEIELEGSVAVVSGSKAFEGRIVDSVDII